MENNPKMELQQKTTVYCNICNERMVETAPAIYFCVNGHKKMIVDLVETAPKKEKEIKRKRSITVDCPFCKKPAEIVEQTKILNKIARKYTCGHTELTDMLIQTDGRDSKWNKFFPFQQEAIEFTENADYNAMMNHEMGLGKTIIALGTLRYNYDDLTPTLIICEAAKVYDWKAEYIEWVADSEKLRESRNGNNSTKLKIENEPIIHQTGKFGLVPGFNVHIISMSLLSKPKVLESILEYGFKFMIVDESHSFKNEDAERTYSLQKIAKEIPRKIFLTGTPVMNKVEELFVPLNILNPAHVPSKGWLIARCDQSSDGRILGINKHYRPRFFGMIENYVLRRTKKEVNIQLPALRVHPELINISNQKMYVQGYNKIVDELESVLNRMENDAKASNEILGLLARLRHLVGSAKIQPVIARVKEFMEQTDPEQKMTIGVHHKSVMEKLVDGLSEYKPIHMSDESGEIKMRRLEQFKQPQHRLLIASILGCGQGLNIQFCTNAIIMEREWNPAKEDQFKGRFHRPVKDEFGNIRTEFSDDDAVVIDILNAADTIDEFLDAILKLKYNIVESSVDHNFDYDVNVCVELARKITQTRLKLQLF